MNDPLNLDQPTEAAEKTPSIPVSESGPARANGVPVSDRPDVHLLDYVKILYKRRYLAISVFVTVVAVVTVTTYTAVPLFEAKTKLLIEAENPNVVSFKEVIDEQQARQDYYQTQYSILQSRSLARKTLETLQLWSNPTFAAQAGKGPNTLKGYIAAAINGVKALFVTEPDPSESSTPGADETIAQSKAIDAFLSHLSVNPVRGTRLVEVAYRLPEPALATRIVNEVAKNYIDQSLEVRFLASRQATAFLEDRLADQRQQVQAADEALQKYREQNDSVSIEDRQNVVVQKLSDLTAAVTRAKTVRIEKEAVYNELRSSQANPASLDSFPAILTNSFIQQLKGQLADLQRQQAQLSEKFGDQHPSMITVNSAIASTQQKLDGEIRKVVQSVKSEYEQALAQEQSLTSALSQQRAEAMLMNKKSIEYSVLDREAKSSKAIYDSLMQRAKETGVSGELRTSNIRVVDLAEAPRRPVYPDKSQNALLAIFGGGLLALVLVFTFEYFDNRIKTPEEVKTYLGLPHLGMLPLMQGDITSGAESGYPLLDGAIPANFSEAFRVLRTNVLFSSAEAGGQSVLVTSTGPGEGKSLVAANLAVSLAQAGRRVLLIDADMRKPKVYKAFDIAQEPGLSNLLVGNVKASEAVIKSRVNGLWLLPSGRIPPNPAELMGSQRFGDFIVSLRSHFDWVVIDSPPVMAVADASVIAHKATGVLFVIGAEMTSRHAARRAVEQVETSHGRFFGAVLNRVDLERNAYYYSQYYRREYSRYYTSA